LNNFLEYKGYYGTVEYSSNDSALFGKVLGINGLISYEGNCVKSLQDDFNEAIDDYINMCDENSIEPQKVFRGNFNVRVSPELHRQLVLYAASCGQSLNSTVEEAIKAYVSIEDK
jgi:predicted HicB family RNase H-like nuclease